MNTPTEIRDIADMRLEEAETLMQHGFYDGAYYLVGYALELNLKAKVCECLGVDNFYTVYVPRSELSKAFMVHKLDRLLLLSGLQTVFTTERITNPLLIQYWSDADAWSEKVRYDSRNTHSQTEANDLIIAVKYLIQWINAH